jgi:hypothetical protein
MDEPFGALDPITRSELHVEFKRLQAALRRAVIHSSRTTWRKRSRSAIVSRCSSRDGLSLRHAGCGAHTSSDPRVAALVATRPGAEAPKGEGG